MTPREVKREEQDMRDLSGLRDTLELAAGADARIGSKAARVARAAESLVIECEDALRRGLDPCCLAGVPEVRWNGQRWTARCPDCGRTVRGGTLEEVEDAWNAWADDAPEAGREEAVE